MRPTKFMLAAAIMAALVVPLPGRASATVQRTAVTIPVYNPTTYEFLTVHGGLFQRSDRTACGNSVLVLVHGLSYGEFAWDFPVQRDTYSVARSLAAAGYPTLAIDLPGYDSAQPDTRDKPNGYTLTVQAYAHMVGQVETALRYGNYGGPAFSKVGLMGHSAGTEITELAAGLGFADPDVYIPTGYHHVPSQRIVTDFFTGDFIRAAQSDYEYFGGDEQGRTEYMYAPLPSDNVDETIVAADNALANLTPSGEVYSIGPQPSKAVMGLIDAPVLFVIGDTDLLFPVEFVDAELNLFASAPSVTKLIVEDAGHSFMLHKNAPQTNAAIAAWLATQSSVFPAC
ncbi:MAG TPA: alpha/beta hydrolase [Actinomycetota bacterium]|nr:alpha/beta hydrolase [Actinomycetota bacterium]